MRKEEILKQAKEIITEEVEKAGYKVEQIILFGSRARGEESAVSDWDFYVVVDRDIDFRKKREIYRYIQRKLVAKEIYSDVLIQSKRVVDEKKNKIGYVSYYAFQEGFTI